jgi:hypothetical protein
MKMVTACERSLNAFKKSSLVESESAQLLVLPAVASDSWAFAVAAGCAAFLRYVVASSAAASALYVYGFAHASSE